MLLPGEAQLKHDCRQTLILQKAIPVEGSAVPIALQALLSAVFSDLLQE